MSNFIKVSPLSSEYTTDTAINNVYVKDNTRGWLRYIRIGIFGVVLNSDNITYDLTGEAYEFSETEFDISFSIKYSSSSSDSTPTAEITLRNLSNELQWKLKKYMKITINAGYIGSNNNGLVFSGQIKNIVDDYDSDGSVSLKLTCISLYSYSKVLVKTQLYAADTSYNTIIQDVCNLGGIPLNVNEISDEYTCPRKEMFSGTISSILSLIVNRINNHLVETEQLTDLAVQNGEGYVVSTDREYVEIKLNGGNSMYAIAFNYDNGLLSVQREDILSDSYTSGENITTVNATIQFNWRIRLDSIVSIDSYKQPHLNGVYKVASYEMEANSHSGSHTVVMGLYPVIGFARSISDLTGLYSLEATPPSE